MTTKLKPAFLHKKSEDPNMIRFSYLVLLKRKNVPEQNGSSGKTAVGLVLGAMKRVDGGFTIDKLAYNNFATACDAWRTGVSKTCMFVYVGDSTHPIVCRTADDIKYVLTLSKIINQMVEIIHASSVYHYFIEDSVPIPHTVLPRDNSNCFYNIRTMTRYQQLVSECSEALPAKLMKKAAKNGWIKLDNKKNDKHHKQDFPGILKPEERVGNISMVNGVAFDDILKKFIKGESDHPEE